MLVFSFEWFYTSNFWALYSLLFGMSQDSVLKPLPWPIMVYFYKLLFGWRVVSLALIPHLPISFCSKSGTYNSQVVVMISKVNKQFFKYPHLVDIWPICTESCSIAFTKIDKTKAFYWNMYVYARLEINFHF